VGRGNVNNLGNEESPKYSPLGGVGLSGEGCYGVLWGGGDWEGAGDGGTRTPRLGNWAQGGVKEQKGSEERVGAASGAPTETRGPSRYDTTFADAAEKEEERGKAIAATRDKTRWLLRGRPNS